MILLMFVTGQLLNNQFFKKNQFLLLQSITLFAVFILFELVDNSTTELVSISIIFNSMSYLNNKNNIIVVSQLIILVLLFKRQQSLMNYSNIMILCNTLYIIFADIHLDLVLKSDEVTALLYKNINNNLLNGLLLLHPPLLYLTYITIGGTYFNNTNHLGGRRVFTFLVGVGFYKNLTILCYITTFTLLLGC